MIGRGRVLSAVGVTVTVAITTMFIMGVDGQCFSENDDLTTMPTYHDISGMINFDLNLFKELYLSSKQNQNVFISPYSIWSSILLVYLGAAGRTRAQMEKVMGITDKMTTLKTWRVLEYMYEDRQGADSHNTFVLANRAFVAPWISINPCFTNFLHDELEQLDLSQIFQASTRINEFIHERTFGQISQLVKPIDLKRAVVVLANAAAFKGTWHEKFDSKGTTGEKFYTSPEEYTTVPMMKLQGKFKYGKSSEIGAQVLELPYSDGYTSMYLMLPGLNTGLDLGLAELIKRLTPERIRSGFTTMRYQEVKIKLPRFKLHYSVDTELMQALYDMGMKDLFTEGMANLTAMAPDGGLLVSKSLHQANVEVNEDGTEASAATIFITESRTKVGPPPAMFVCNRPFIFVIYDNFTGNILFIGTYRNVSN